MAWLSWHERLGTYRGGLYTHSSTNQAQRRENLLIDTDVLPLSQTTISLYSMLGVCNESFAITEAGFLSCHLGNGSS